MSVDVSVQLNECSEPVEQRASTAGETSDWHRTLASARAGDNEALGRLLQQLRDYLLLVADREFDRRLQAKSGASDLVQNTLLEAGRDIQAFLGNSEAELRAWLLRILRHNATDLAREFCSTHRRNVQREQRLSGMAQD